MRDLLAMEKKVADSHAKKQIEEYAAEQETECTLSNKKCIWKGCERFAIEGSVMCCCHAISDTERAQLVENFYNPETILEALNKNIVNPAKEGAVDR